MQIHKYTLGIRDEQTVDMPEGAKILTAQIQDARLCVWAVVNPEAKKVKQIFNIYGTGHELPAKTGRYVSTVQIGFLVWHIFVQGK
jgi:hypothetical protein